MRWPVVPQGLQRAAVAPGTGPPVRSYGMDAAFMSFQLHGRGNHAVRSGADMAIGAGARFRGAVATGQALP